MEHSVSILLLALCSEVNNARSAADGVCSLLAPAAALRDTS